MPFDLQKQNKLAGNLEYENKFLTVYCNVHMDEKKDTFS